MRAVVRGLFGVDWGVGGDPAGWPQQQSWLRGSDQLRGSDSVDKPYSQVGPFQRVVSVISRDAASVPWEFFAFDADGEPGDEPVPNHPVSQLWSKPNGHMTGNQLLIGSYISKMVFGEYFWHYPKLAMGRRGSMRALERSSGELLLLYPPKVKRELQADGTIAYALRDESGIDQPIDSRRLTHSRRYNPYSQVQGLSLAASIMADLIGYYAAAQWNARFFNEQNGVPTILLMPGEKSALGQSEDDRHKFMRRFTQRTANKRTVAALPSGWTAQDFGLSQRDMDFAELRQFGRDEVLANAGVPPLIAGYLTRPITYNASEQKQSYWQSTINNFLTEEQSVINEDFLPKVGVSERVFPKWEVVKALLENLVEKTEVAGKLFSMGFTKRQINDRLELGFDVDELEDPDTGYLPFNLMPVSLVLNPPPLPQLPTPNDGNEETDGGTNGEAKGFNGGFNEVVRTMLWRRLVNQTRDLEARFNSTVRGHMHSIEQEVLENVNGTKGWLATQKQDETTPIQLLLFDIDKAKRSLQSATVPIHREALKRGGESVLLDIGAGIDFELADPIARAKIAELTGKITRIDDTIEHALRVSLQEGIVAGESPQQLAARVRSVMDASQSRSMTIARTETGFAYSTGRNVGMQQAGVEKHEWLSARDARVRDDHAKSDGDVVPIGQPFPDTGLQYPNDPNGPPGQIINCRCVAVPVLEE